MKIIGKNSMLDSIDMGDYRLMLYYKGDISALTLFLQQENGSICFPKKLPLLSSPIDPIDFQIPKVTLFPILLVNAINTQLQLPNDLLIADAGFNEQIETPKGITTVYMARFMLLDPPHKLVQSRGCSLKTLPELRGRPPAEMELLRRAYTYVMES
jgi:hypothetical protein